MITCYFGVPRVGKNTMLTMIAQRELRRMRRGKSKYEHIYTDFYCKGCERITFTDLDKNKIYNSLVMFEEMGLSADNREFKTFKKGIRDFFVLHGHLHNDIIYATQEYTDVDLKIRKLTEELWYLKKSCVPILKHFTLATRIFRKININEFTAELTVGYRFADILERIFVRPFKICFRPLYYKKFDSHDEGVLAVRPEYQGEPWDKNPVTRRRFFPCIGKLSNPRARFCGSDVRKRSRRKSDAPNTL